MVKFLPILVCCLCFNWMSAQNADKHRAQWHYLAELYLMFPNMGGDVKIGMLPKATVDASSSNILGNLKFGTMLFVEATNDNWAITGDFLYMDLEQPLESTQPISDGQVGMQQWSLEIAGLKNIAPWFELGLAGRVVSLGSDMSFTGALENPQKGSVQLTWFDPVILIRSQGLIKEKWIMQGRLDFGGFGVGSEFSWQVQAYVGYRFSKCFQTTIGYRYIYMLYERDAEGDISAFTYDMATYGAVIRLGLNF